MNWKNTVENLLYMVVIFVGLAIYTSVVLKPIIIESIRQENTKIENNIKNNIDNKFKKIDELNARIPLFIAPENIQQPTVIPEKQSINIPYEQPTLIKVEGIPCGDKSVCIEIKHLTRRQKKRLGIK